jgi:hypothetical protein
VAKVRKDFEIESDDGSVSGDSGPGSRPTSARAEEVGIYGNGMKAVPRPRKSLRTSYLTRRRARVAGMLIVFVAAIAVVSAVAMAPSAKDPMVPADANKGPHILAAPHASFTAVANDTDLMMVWVNATLSTDDGTIVSYDWTFGDGGVGTGVTAEHKYSLQGKYWVTLVVTDDESLTDTLTMQFEAFPNGIPPPAYVVLGYAYDSVGSVVPGITVVVTDLRTGNTWTGIDDIEPGFYIIDLNSNVSGWLSGDTINVTVTSGALIGWGEKVAGSEGEVALQIDVTMVDNTIPEFSTIVLPVVGIAAVVAVIGLGSRRCKH